MTAHERVLNILQNGFTFENTDGPFCRAMLEEMDEALFSWIKIWGKDSPKLYRWIVKTMDYDNGLNGTDSLPY